MRHAKSFCLEAITTLLLTGHLSRVKPRSSCLQASRWVAIPRLHPLQLKKDVGGKRGWLVMSAVSCMRQTCRLHRSPCMQPSTRTQRAAFCLVMQALLYRSVCDYRDCHFSDRPINVIHQLVSITEAADGTRTPLIQTLGITVRSI